jgi:hypothetical protein
MVAALCLLRLAWLHHSKFSILKVNRLLVLHAYPYSLLLALWSSIVSLDNHLYDGQWTRSIFAYLPSKKPASTLQAGKSAYTLPT